MGNRKLIVRLDDRDHDADVSSLLGYFLDGRLEVVDTEQHGADAVVGLSGEQAQSLTRALRVATEASRGQDARSQAATADERRAREEGKR